MDKSVLLMSAVLASASLEASAQAKDKSPNIVFVLADDMGIGDLGCYGQKKIKRPTLICWRKRDYCLPITIAVLRLALLHVVVCSPANIPDMDIFVVIKG